MSRSTGAMSARLVGRALGVLRAREIDAEPILAAVGLSRAALESNHARVPYSMVDALLERIAERIPPSELGLALARTRDDAAYGAAGLLLLTSPTYRAGLERSIGYQRIWGDGQRFSIAAEGDLCQVRFRHPGQSPLARAVLAECALGEIVEGARVLVDPVARPRRVELSHSPLGDPEPLSHYFGVQVRFGAAANAIAFGPEVADHPLHLVRDLLTRAIEEQCRQWLHALPARPELVARARLALREFIAESPKLPTIASRLNMSARTLQRALSREGTSFQELLDLERRARAEELLTQGAAFKEAALRVGYADPGALARARRRWRDRK